MKLSNLSLILSASLTVFAGQAAHGKASNLLNVGKAEAAKYRHGDETIMPGSKMSTSAHKELEDFELRTTNFNRTKWTFNDQERIIIDRNATRTGGTVQTLKVAEDGTMTRSAFELPKSSLKLEEIDLAGAMDQRGLPKNMPAFSVTRKFSTLSGKFDVNETFYLSEVGGKLLRRTRATYMTTEKFYATIRATAEVDGEVPLTNVRSLDLKVEMRGADGFRNDVFNGTLKLPENIKGDIIHWNMNTTATRVTVITSEGQQLEFPLTVTSHENKRIGAGTPNINKLPGGLEEFATQTKIYPGRKSANKSSVKGLEVESAATTSQTSAASH